MTALTTLRHSALWQPIARLYQRSGIKARVYSWALHPPVATLAQHDIFDRFHLTASRHRAAPVFAPPIPADCGPMPAEDAEFLTRFIAALRPKHLFEFGTNWGVSSAAMISNAPPDAHLWTLDVCREMFDEDALRADPELQMILKREHTGWHYTQCADLASRVTQIFADSLTFDIAAFDTGETRFDFILVDACHKYEFVKRDTENALKCLAPGGFMLWHDFYPDVSSWADVFAYVSEFAHAHSAVFHVEGTHFALWQRPIQ